jgi:hypothetical protein
MVTALCWRAFCAAIRPALGISLSLGRNLVDFWVPRFRMTLFVEGIFDFLEPLDTLAGRQNTEFRAGNIHIIWTINHGFLLWYELRN